MVKRFVFTLNFVFLLSPFFLHPMKRIISWPEEDVKSSKKRKTLLPLKLSQVRVSPDKNEYYCDFASQYKDKLTRHVPEDLPLLHRIAFLPRELQNTIFTYMLCAMFEDNAKVVAFHDKEEIVAQIETNKQCAIEKFCNKSMIDSIALYQSIIKKIRLHDPVTPLYIMPKYRRNEFLSKLHKPWYRFCCDPFISKQETSEIQKLDSDLQQYFTGKKTLVLDYDFTCEKVGLCVIGISFAGLCLTGGFPLLLVPFIGFDRAYSPPMLTNIAVGSWSLVTLTELVCVYDLIKEMCQKSERITL